MLYNNPKPQDTKEGLSDQDFSIYMDAHTVPFSKYPSYMPAGVLGICTEGNAEIQVGLRKYVICANDILIPTYLFTKESITNLLKLPFLELYADYYSTVKEHKVTTLHKEEIGYFFLDLLLKHYKENKEVAFYAEKLHVSSKYLTEALTLVSGKSPKEWIIHYTLQEIYALLENPSISIQEIVQRTRFANLATLRRFFKRHTGTSLLQYRKQDLYKNNQ